MDLFGDQSYQAKILVIDDERRIREGCSKILKRKIVL